MQAMLTLKRCFSGFHGQFGRLHGFRSMTLLYSKSEASKDGVTNPLMVEFLVKSVGFSEDVAVSVVANCKVSHRFKSTKNPELVVDFFKDRGFNESHIRKVVLYHPMVLNSRVEKTLKPKIRAFEELGLSGSDLGVIISEQPHFLLRSVSAYIGTALELLESFIGSNEQLVRFMLKKVSDIVIRGSDFKNLSVNLLLLQSYGLTRAQIKRFILHRFSYLLYSTEVVEEAVKGVEEKLGIPQTSGMFIYGIYALCYKKGDPFEPCFKVFRGYGFSNAEILSLVRKWPLALTMPEKVLKGKLKYFIEDIGFGSDYLAARPALLSYSMKKRIVPRTAVRQALQEKQLLKQNISLYYFLSMPESKFMEKVMLPIKDKLPELYEYYAKAKGGSLSKA